jgi:plastocyanin
MRKTSRGILKNSSYLLFSIFLLCNCSGPSVKSPSTEGRVVGQPHIDTVSISDMKFQPDMINVHKGDTIVWINHDMVTHCVTGAGDKPWTSSPIPSGGSWKMAITESSDYYCAIHQIMKGKIVVE